MRPSKCTLFLPACALKINRPTILLFTVRPARWVKSNRTVAGAVSEKVNVVPTGSLALAKPTRLLPSRHLVRDCLSPVTTGRRAGGGPKARCSAKGVRLAPAGGGARASAAGGAGSRG